MLCINTFHKNLSFKIIFSKQNYIFIKILKKLNFINKFLIIKCKSNIFLKIYPLYYKHQQIGKSFKLISKPSKSFFISLKALKLLNKRSGVSLYLLSTSKGLMTHKSALQCNLSGVIVGVLSF